MDQLLASISSSETQLGSLELAMDPPNNAGACTGNLSCVYTHTLSWRSPTQPLPTEWNPRVVFEKLFGDSGSTVRSAREARMMQHKSILDSVTEKLATLKTELGPGDQVKVDEFTDIGSRRRAPHSDGRSTEGRGTSRHGAAAGRAAGIRRSSGADVRLESAGVPVRSDARDHVHDLARSRARGPIRRSACRKRTTRCRITTICRSCRAHVQDQPYHVKLFSDYLAKLKATPDGDGSLLDHITILYGAGISNSNRHSGDNLPILLAGGGSGRIKGGRHIKYTGKPSMANLLVTLMDKMDVPVDHMGASTGKLPIDALRGVGESSHAHQNCSDIASDIRRVFDGGGSRSAFGDPGGEKRRQGGAARADPEKGRREPGRGRWRYRAALGQLS